MCELKNTVRPRSRSARISSRTSRRPSGSSPDIGSSRKTTSGSLRSACARPTRCSIPFENLRSGSRRSAPMPDLVEQRRDRAAPRPRASRPNRPREVAQQLLGGQVVVEVRVLGQVADAPAHADVADRPAEDLARRPTVGKISCISSFSVVVLPAPFGPRKPKHLARATPGASGGRARGTGAGARTRRVVLRQVLGFDGVHSRIRGPAPSPVCRPPWQYRQISGQWLVARLLDHPGLLQLELDGDVDVLRGSGWP